MSEFVKGHSDQSVFGKTASKMCDGCGAADADYDMDDGMTLCEDCMNESDAGLKQSSVKTAEDIVPITVDIRLVYKICQFCDTSGYVDKRPDGSLRCKLCGGTWTVDGDVPIDRAASRKTSVKKSSALTWYQPAGSEWEAAADLDNGGRLLIHPGGWNGQDGTALQITEPDGQYKYEFYMDDARAYAAAEQRFGKVAAVKTADEGGRPGWYKSSDSREINVWHYASPTPGWEPTHASVRKSNSVFTYTVWWQDPVTKFIEDPSQYLKGEGSSLEDAQEKAEAAFQTKLQQHEGY